MDLTEFEEMEKKIEEYLGVKIDDLREEILRKALIIDVDYCRKVHLSICGKGDYSISIIQSGAQIENYGGGFSYEFSMITPWDVNGFESVHYIGNSIYIDVDINEEFFEEELLYEALNSAINGYCGKFEDEFKEFVIEFNEYIMKKEGE